VIRFDHLPDQRQERGHSSHAPLHAEHRPSGAINVWCRVSTSALIRKGVKVVSKRTFQPGLREGQETC